MAAGIPDYYLAARELGLRMVRTERTEGISTTDIIARVLKMYAPASAPTTATAPAAEEQSGRAGVDMDSVQPPSAAEEPVPQAKMTRRVKSKK